jgi:hypothetical protein
MKGDKFIPFFIAFNCGFWCDVVNLYFYFKIGLKLNGLYLFFKIFICTFEKYINNIL